MKCAESLRIRRGRDGVVEIATVAVVVIIVVDVVLIVVVVVIIVVELPGFYGSQFQTNRIRLRIPLRSRRGSSTKVVVEQRRHTIVVDSVGRGDV